jgi:hypothetical protein
LEGDAALIEREPAGDEAPFASTIHEAIASNRTPTSTIAATAADSMGKRIRTPSN